MTTGLRTLHDVPVLVHPADGATLACEADALDLIGDAGYQGARWAAVPAERLGADFYDLRTGLAGTVVQKFAQYGLGLAVVGDISRHTAASSALADLVRESNRGRQTWFVPDLDTLADRLRA